MKNEENRWRMLDNSAKIFSIAGGKRYSTVFRYSVVMTEKVEAKELVKAVDKSLDKFKYFRMKLKMGAFWNYLEYNEKEPIIEEESEYPCAYVNPKKCNDYLFRVSYYNNKISIDFFHVLTDGNSALEFFKEIIYTYIELIHPEKFEISVRDKDFIKYDFSAADDFIKYYDKNLNGNSNNELAYEIDGDVFITNQIGTIHEYLESDKLKSKAKEYNATITQYLSAVLIYAIYKGNMKDKETDKPIKLCIPVNLRRYFQSKTVSNFFSYFTVVAHVKKDGVISFDSILNMVKKEFEDKLTFEEINKTMSANVKLGINPIIKYIPLPLKKLLVGIGYGIIRKFTTITFSNVGRIGIIKEYQPYIKHALFMIAPEPVEKIKVSAISYDNITSVSFSTNMADTKIEQEFRKIVKSQGLTVKTETNGVVKIPESNNSDIKTPYPKSPRLIKKKFVHLEKYRNNAKRRRESFHEKLRKRFSS